MNVLQETATRLAGRVRAGQLSQTTVERIALTGDDPNVDHDTARVLVLWGYVLGVGASGLCRQIVGELQLPQW